VTWFGFGFFYVGVIQGVTKKMVNFLKVVGVQLGLSNKDTTNSVDTGSSTQRALPNTSGDESSDFARHLAQQRLGEVSENVGGEQSVGVDNKTLLKNDGKNLHPFNFPNWLTCRSALLKGFATAGLAITAVVCGVFAIGMLPHVVVGGAFFAAGVLLCAKSSKGSSKDKVWAGFVITGLILAAPATGLVASCWGISQLFKGKN
jgi:hypothetical protein